MAVILIIKYQHSKDIDTNNVQPYTHSASHYLKEQSEAMQRESNMFTSHSLAYQGLNPMLYEIIVSRFVLER